MADKMYWMGEDVESLPRDRLIEIIREMGVRLEQANASAIAINQTWSAIVKAASRVP